MSSPPRRISSARPRPAIDQLGALVDRIEAAPELTVVVFRSDNPGYFMAHWDFLADKALADTLVVYLPSVPQ
ncbi:MAG TPA: hypothetical protein VF951_15750 [Streptosporangiaceae bacterium]